jgi:hypothetical protein
MVAFSSIPRVNPLAAPVGAAAAGASVALLFALVPDVVLENWVWASGVPALVAAAAPPLGATARAVLALAGGALVASVVWSLLYLLVGPGGPFAPETVADAVPVVRRADAHPDAPPRRPMTAAEMGTPLMEVAPLPPLVVRPVPADLDQPLSAFDPGAIPDVPLTPPAPVAPLVKHPLAPGERIETYALPSPAQLMPAHEPRRRSGSVQPSIDALLKRLEEVSAQRMGAVAR